MAMHSKSFAQEKVYIPFVYLLFCSVRVCHINKKSIIRVFKINVSENLLYPDKFLCNILVILGNLGTLVLKPMYVMNTGPLTGITIMHV